MDFKQLAHTSVLLAVMFSFTACQTGNSGGYKHLRMQIKENGRAEPGNPFSDFAMSVKPSCDPQFDVHVTSQRPFARSWYDWQKLYYVADQQYLLRKKNCGTDVPLYMYAHQGDWKNPPVMAARRDVNGALTGITGMPTYPPPKPVSQRAASSYSGEMDPVTKGMVIFGALVVGMMAYCAQNGCDSGYSESADDINKKYDKIERDQRHKDCMNQQLQDGFAITPCVY
ncbi:MAG: hypothetical protein DI551_03000 [Micavibrio aeruginosavorus]|uniref:Lipoprotein n=1 Tax=Micavibrio aeruginosavorus TaxID=349221 RepID=A0A2W5NAA7_9BACT|nr:MAG: hypothetical protein DI551_03000 [Micavibrio aeruginosavorus]